MWQHVKRHRFLTLCLVVTATVVFAVLLRTVMQTKVDGASVAIMTLADSLLAEEFTGTTMFAEAAQTQGQPFTNLTLRLSTGRERYALGEIVEFTVELANETNGTIVGHTYLKPEDGFLQMRIAQGNENVKDYYGALWDANDFIPIAGPLPPRFTITQTATLFFNRSTHKDPEQYLAFPRAGVYHLQAALQNVDTPDLLTSNVVRIEMMPLTGDDAVVWKQLRQYDNALSYQTGYDRGDSMGNFMAILRLYPGSTYAAVIQERVEKFQMRQLKQEQQGQASAQQTQKQITVMAGGQQVWVQVEPSASINDEEATIGKLTQLTEAWVAAWNASDIDRYAQFYSYRNDFRQKWETGVGNFNYESERKRIEALLAQNGALTVEILGFTVTTNEIIAEVVGRFERGSNNYFFDTVRFVLDDDGVWRLYSPAF